MSASAKTLLADHSREIETTCCELHTVRALAIDKLVTRLREHAAHEDKGLYTWAASHLVPEALAQVAERIRSSAAALGATRDVTDRPTLQP